VTDGRDVLASRFAGITAERAPVVLVDGPSGAGKTTFAASMAAGWPGRPAPVLVRMDDIYPGWHGLDAASAHVVERLLLPRSRGEASGWRRFDWSSGRSAEWRDVAVDSPLILEGCGALSRRAARLADLRIWIDADETVRKTRALARDGGAFDGHWDMWAEQVDAFTAREDPMAHADAVLRNDAGEAQVWLRAFLRSVALEVGEERAEHGDGV
jgi:hypothetical protein